MVEKFSPHRPDQALRVIVGEQGIGATDTEAVLWIDRTPHYLKDYLRANGIPDASARWIRTGTLIGVSPDGRILVGNGAPIGATTATS